MLHRRLKYSIVVKGETEKRDKTPEELFLRINKVDAHGGQCLEVKSEGRVYVYLSE